MKSENMSTLSDGDNPQTYRSDSCYQALFDSYNLGAIYENAPQYASKADARAAAPIPGGYDAYAMVAKEGGTEGLLINEPFVSVAAGCSNGSLTGRTLLGRVTIESDE